MRTMLLLQIVSVIFSVLPGCDFNSLTGLVHSMCCNFRIELSLADISIVEQPALFVTL